MDLTKNQQEIEKKHLSFSILEPSEENCRIRIQIRIRKSVVPGTGIIFSQNIKYAAFFPALTTKLELLNGAPVLQIRDVYPGSEFFYPGSRVTTKNLIIFKPKNWLKSLGNMIRDAYPGFFDFFYSSQIPVPGVKKALDPGSGSATGLWST